MQPATTSLAEQLTFNIEDLAGILGIAKITAERMKAAGKLPAPDVVLSQRTIRWSRATIERWLAAGCPAQDASKARRTK